MEPAPVGFIQISLPANRDLNTCARIFIPVGVVCKKFNQARQMP
jgi:hypothetical protein